MATKQQKEGINLIENFSEFKEFKKFCKEWLKDKNFDQFISEEEIDGIPHWIHLGYRSMRRGQRKQFLYTTQKEPNKYIILK